MAAAGRVKARLRRFTRLERRQLYLGQGLNFPSGFVTYDPQAPTTAIELEEPFDGLCWSLPVSYS